MSDGVLGALRAAGVDRVDNALVLGGGGTAAAAVLALAEQSPADRPCRIVFAGRRPESTADVEDLALRLGLPAARVELSASAVGRVADAAGLVVSTVPAGWRRPRRCRCCQGAALFDVVYHPWPTALAARWRAGPGHRHRPGHVAAPGVAAVRVDDRSTRPLGGHARRVTGGQRQRDAAAACRRAARQLLSCPRESHQPPTVRHRSIAASTRSTLGAVATSASRIQRASSVVPPTSLRRLPPMMCPRIDHPPRQQRAVGGDQPALGRDQVGVLAEEPGQDDVISGLLEHFSHRRLLGGLAGFDAAAGHRPQRLGGFVPQGEQDPLLRSWFVDDHGVGAGAGVEVGLGHDRAPYRPDVDNPPGAATGVRQWPGARICREAGEWVRRR